MFKLCAEADPAPPPDLHGRSRVGGSVNSQHVLGISTNDTLENLSMRLFFSRPKDMKRHRPKLNVDPVSLGLRMSRTVAKAYSNSCLSNGVCTKNDREKADAGKFRHFDSPLKTARQPRSLHRRGPHLAK